MSDAGEHTCPICAEEMDLTDQQLKPCDCGYEVCLWCWNHIMEMAEKDGREGRCPLCRSPYDKEKIMRVAADCKAVAVAEVNPKRKQKKPANKGGLEAKKNLTDVRVLQRNLAYIIGLPLHLAKEELLKRREYFGQYGKVLKVSVSRTSTGDIQHATNNSCCLYITYSSEYETARCIRSVHGFILDGNSLRACFGTTKYCHAWLKNVPCSNAECMYLHDFASQEDSFSKDELVSAFERSKDLQIIGVTNNMHQRAGKGLPPPVDENNKAKILSAAKPPVSQPINRDEFMGSYADGDSRRATPSRTSGVMQVASGVPLGKIAEMPSYRKPETCNDVYALSSKVVSDERYNHEVRSITSNDSFEVRFNSLDPLVLTEQNSEENVEEAVSNKFMEPSVDSTLVSLSSRHCLSPDNGLDRDIKSVDFISSRNLNCPSPNVSKSSFDDKGTSFATFDPSSVLRKMEFGKYVEEIDSNKASTDCNLSSDTEESGIISNILMMNLDTPDDSLTELHKWVNLLGGTDKECSLLRIPSLCKVPEKKQSMFSFAQEEDSSDNTDSFIHTGSSNIPRSNSLLSHKSSATEVPISIPPGFSVPRRASPPGFSSHGRSIWGDQAFHSSAKQPEQESVMPTDYPGITSNDELLEPPIFNIGNGITERGGALLSQYNSSQPDARLRLISQQSTPRQQNLKFHDHFRNTYSTSNNRQLLSPQNANQFLSNPSIFTQSTPRQVGDVHVSNGHWDQWNGVKSETDLGISELLRNESLGCNKFIPYYEESKTRSSYFRNLKSKGFEM